jgi:hypothetical protein
MNARKRFPNRIAHAAAVLALGTLSATTPAAYAQALETRAPDTRAAERLAARQAMEPIFSVFVYERLGATPSLRMRQRAAAPTSAAVGRENNAFGTFTYDALRATPSLTPPRGQTDGAEQIEPRGE